MAIVRKDEKRERKRLLPQKTIILFFSGAIILTLLLMFLFTYFIKSHENSSNKDEQVSNLEKNNQKEQLDSKAASLFIDEYHNKFNQLTNYDAYKNMDWDEADKSLVELSKKADQLKKEAPNNMVLDLERLHQLAEIDKDNHDPTAAVYIHRILHDLDIAYNSLEHTKFGYSSFDSGENQSKVNKYIESHSMK